MAHICRYLLMWALSFFGTVLRIYTNLGNSSLLDDDLLRPPIHQSSSASGVYNLRLIPCIHSSHSPYHRLLTQAACLVNFVLSLKMFFSTPISTQPQASGSVALPLPATTRTSPSTTTSPIDDFFGSTRGSRHDCRFSVSSNKEDDLPLYSDVEALAPPSYSQRGHKEPVTLAMYLFKFGFCEYSPLFTYKKNSFLPLFSQCSRHSGYSELLSLYQTCVLLTPKSPRYHHHRTAPMPSTSLGSRTRRPLSERLSFNRSAIRR